MRARVVAAARDAGGGGRGSSRSGARSGTAHGDSARTAGRGAPRLFLSRHGLDSPVRAPAPPWGSAATGEASAGAGPPSRSRPLRVASGPGTPSVVVAPRPAPSVSAPRPGCAPGASPAVAAARTVYTAPGPRRTPDRTRTSLYTPRTSRTARPRCRRSFTERLDARTRTPHAVHRQMRVVAPPPRRLGCTSTRAFTFSDPLALRRHRWRGIDEVEGSNRGDFVRLPRPLAGADSDLGR
jgi:hypothetical protein